MLPLVPSSGLRAKSITALGALAIAAGTAAPAHAWGKNEQNFLKGVLAAVVVDRIIHETRKPQRHSTQPPVQQRYVPAYAPVPPAPATGYGSYGSYGSYGTSLYRTPAAQVFNSFSYSERQAIQRRLAAQGYYRSSIDGAFGPGTYNAVLAYARDTGNTRALESANGAYSVYDRLLY